MGWLTDYFRPAPKLPPQPDSEADWAAGDCAECIGKLGWLLLDGRPNVGPAYRQTLRVASVSHDFGTVWLGFLEFGPNIYPGGHFRKLRPARGASWLQKARCKRDLVPA